MSRRQVESLDTAIEHKKRYFIIRTNGQTKFEFPQEFAAARGRKWVYVLGAHLYKEDSESASVYERPNYCWLHASFVEDDPYENGLVMLCNNETGDRKKYEQFSSTKYFTVWLEDFAGQSLPLNTHTWLILDMMLEWS